MFSESPQIADIVGVLAVPSLPEITSLLRVVAGQDPSSSGQPHPGGDRVFWGDWPEACGSSKAVAKLTLPPFICACVYWSQSPGLDHGSIEYDTAALGLDFDK
jgi:hypothetical protein